MTSLIKAESIFHEIPFLKWELTVAWTVKSIFADLVWGQSLCDFSFLGCRRQKVTGRTVFLSHIRACISSHWEVLFVFTSWLWLALPGCVMNLYRARGRGSSVEGKWKIIVLKPRRVTQCMSIICLNKISLFGNSISEWYFGLQLCCQRYSRLLLRHWMKIRTFT